MYNTVSLAGRDGLVSSVSEWHWVTRREEVERLGMGKRGFEGYGYLYKDFEEFHECNIMHDRIHQLLQAEMGDRPGNSAMADSDEAERPPPSGSNQASLC